MGAIGRRPEPHHPAPRCIEQQADHLLPDKKVCTRNARAANSHRKRSAILAIATGSRFLPAETNNSEAGDRQCSCQRNSPTLKRSNLIAARIISLRKR
jgi:hypothetical protein